MRLFVFAIGGTGSRVLTSMIFQLAAGARPVDHRGNPIENLSIVPIIVDPHEENAGLQQVKILLDKYRAMHNKIHDKNPNEEGFYGVKIETLHDIDAATVPTDSFFFRMQRVSTNQFGNFIGMNQMSEENRLMAEMLFSPSELKTNMKEGFFGAPNIGCVALNEFRNSEDFKAFRAAYHEGDRIFFIGSIFGGTGAAGLPLFITSIRDLGHAENMDTGQTSVSRSPIGSLVVMPYFSIADDENSVINQNEFLIKTRSALRYYEDNLNPYVNRTYYVADPVGTQPFKNDSGADNQKDNKAHMVEYAGALAIFDFLSEDAQQLTVTEKDGRIVAEGSADQRYKAYTLHTTSGMVTFAGLSKQTNRLAMKPLMKFFIMSHFMRRHLSGMLDNPFSKKHSPKFEASLYNDRDLMEFLSKFDQWMKEIGGHGTTAHNLAPFGPVNGDDYSECFRKQPSTRKKTFGMKSLKVSDIKSELDKAADRNGDMPSQEARWYKIINEALDKLLVDTFDMDTYM